MPLPSIAFAAPDTPDSVGRTIRYHEKHARMTKGWVDRDRAIEYRGGNRYQSPEQARQNRLDDLRRLRRIYREIRRLTASLAGSR